jgi:hypothetical protein
MLEAFLAYGILSLVAAFPAYCTGRLLLRLFTNYEVETLKGWFARTHTDRTTARRRVFLQYTTADGKGVSAEYAVQVGCLFWISLLVLTPLGIWFLYSAFFSAGSPQVPAG